MKNTKALFVLKIFTFLSQVFGCVEKRLDKKAMDNFKIYDVTDWTTNNYNYNTYCPIFQEVNAIRQ